MLSTTRILMLIVLLGAVAATSGCVGPNKLKRGLDQKLHDGYVEHPLRSQLLFPVSFVLNHLAGVSDLLFVNPWYWWGDVFRGRGTSFEEAVSGGEPGEPESDDDDETSTAFEPMGTLALTPVHPWTGPLGATVRSTGSREVP